MWRGWIRIWLTPLLLTLTSAIVLIALGSGLDRLLIPGGQPHPILAKLSLFGGPGSLISIANTNEFLGALASIAITVASILVQLSATRYSARVMELFVEDRTNLAVFTLFVVTPVYGIYLVFLGDNLVLPSLQVVIFYGLTLASTLLLIPYFSYLFSFLNPEKIVARIKDSVRFSRLSPGLRGSSLQRQRTNLIGSVAQLSDVVLNSLLNSDMNLALLSIDSLRELATDYLMAKGRAPQAWFAVPPRAFLGLEDAKRERLALDRTWVEMHCLKQFELVFVQALNRFREVTAAIGHRTRDVGMTAIQMGDHKAVQLAVLFFNTYLRHALNAADIRTMFHTFYQYRLLAEGCLQADWREQLKTIALYFKYYGQESERRGVPFAMEIAAYDLRVLVERAFEVNRAAATDLLEVFLEVDHAPETSESEKSQRGVRKNQAILAAFFLGRGEAGLARTIFEDMRDEDPSRMHSIHEEILAITSESFWEIQDRDSNFYYLPPASRPHLALFFSWFRSGPPSEFPSSVSKVGDR